MPKVQRLPDDVLEEIEEGERIRDVIRMYERTFGPKKAAEVLGWYGIAAPDTWRNRPH